MTTEEPTVVLVHGAFADGSSWTPVATLLRRRHTAVQVAAVELRSGASDGARLAAQVRDIAGPVLLAGHSWGGVVITEAAQLADNVVGLVYVGGFALDEGEAPLELLSRFPAGPLGAALVARQLPDPDGSQNTWLTVAPERFGEIMAAGADAEQVGVLSIGQRPIRASAFEEKAGAAAWRRLPSWFVIGTQDVAIPPDAQRAMAARAGGVTVELPSPHLSALTHPQEVTDAVSGALRALTSAGDRDVQA